MEAQIKVGLNADGVTQGAEKVKRSLNDLGQAANKAGKDTGAGMAAIGAGGDAASRKVESATRNMQGQLQRLVASFEGGEKGSRKFYESLANQRGVDVASLKPLLDQLDAAKAKFQEASQASEKASGSFGGLGEAAGLAGRAFAALGVAASLKSFITMADASTNLASRLSLVTTSTGQLIQLQNELFNVAQSSRVSFVDLSFTYAQLARSTKDLGVSQSSLIGIVNTISQAVTISGGSAASAQAALVQLSQGFASGALRGEELNSVMEQTPRLAQAIADGLGVSIGKLREMGKAGELTSELVLGALEKSAAAVGAEFGKMALTVEGASTQAANSALKLVGVLDKITGASGLLASGISRVSTGVDTLARDIDRISSTNSLADFFFTAFQNEETLNVELRVTQEELAKINARLSVSPSNIYARSAKAEMEAYIDKLKEAKVRLDQLSGKGVANDATTDSGDSIRFARSAAAEKRRQTNAEDLNNFRLKSSNVPASYVKDMQEIIRLNQEGSLVGAEYTKALKDQQDILLKASGATSKAAAASGAYARAESEASKLLKAANAERIKDGRDAVIMAGLALEKSNDDYQKSLEESAKAADKYIDSLNKSADAVEGQLQKLQDEEEALRLSASANITLAEAIAEVEIARLREKQAAEMSYGNDEAAAAIQREIENRRKQAQLLNSKDAREAAKKGAEKAAEEWQKTADKINDTLTDAFMRGFEDGKGFAEAFGDTLKNMFKTMVLRPIIQASLQPLSNAMAGSGGASGGGSGSLTSLFSSVDAGLTNTMSGGVQALYDAGFNQLGDAAASLSNTVLKASNSVGGFSQALSYANALNTAFTRDAQGGKDYGKAAGQALGTYLGGPIGSFIGGEIGSALGLKDYSGTYHSGGTGAYSADGGLKYGATSYSFGMGASEYTQGANEQSAAIAMAVSGIIDTASSIAGSDKKSFVGTGYADDISPDGAWAGLMIRLGDTLITDWGRGGDKWPGREFADGAEGQKQYLDAIAQDVRKAIDTIGLPEWATQYIDALGEGAGLEGLAQALEKIKLTEAAFVTLGDVFVGLADLSDNAKTQLLKVSGGIEALAGVASAYYDNFYTADEKAARLTGQTAKAFEALGLVMPAINESTRANYRALIDGLAAQDLSIEANARAYTGALSLQGAMNELAPAFKAVEQAANSTAAAMRAIATAQLDNAMQGADSAFDGVARAVEAQRIAITTAYESQSSDIQTSLDAVSASVGKLQALSDTLKSTLDGMRIGGSDASYRAAAQSQISAALATARSGGGLPLDGQLDSALRTVSQPSEQLFGSFEDYARDFYKTANDIAALGEITGVQLTAEQTTQAILNSQLTSLKAQYANDIDALDETLNAAQQQLDALNDVDNSVMSIADAIKELAVAVMAATAIKDAQASASTYFDKNKDVAAAYEKNTYGLTPEEFAKVHYSKFGESEGRDSPVAESQTKAKSYFELYPDVAAAYAVNTLGLSQKEYSAEHFANFGKDEKRIYPGFAQGINVVPYDMTARIHEGESVVPAQFNPYNPNATGKPDNAEMVAELRAMRAELSALKAATVQTAENTKTTAKQLAYWDADGMPATTI